jgi:hypothetical protein
VQDHSEVVFEIRERCRSTTVDESEPPTRLTIARIRDKFETHGTVCHISFSFRGAVQDYKIYMDMEIVKFA